MIILAIGAHYDDVELGCGGTLYKHILKGDEVFIAITSSSEWRTGDVELRKREQINAAEYLGVKRSHILEFDNSLSISDYIFILDRLKADIIFAPYEFDSHQAHVKASTIGKACGRKRTTTTYFYDSGSTYNFHPNIFSIIDFEFKYELLQNFKSQIQCKAINLDIMKKKNSYLASLITEGDTYAEAFIGRKLLYKECE